MTTEAPKAKRFDPEAFKAFVKAKAGESYPGFQPTRCALAKFGFRHVTAERLLGVPEELYYEVISPPHTYSALASRLDALS